MTMRVFIVDDHPIFREGLAQVIRGDDRLELAGAAGDAEEALSRLRQLKPDVAVLDVELPGRSGLDLAADLLRFEPPIPSIALTMHKDESLFNLAMDRGVTGYILKENAVTDLIQGIQAVARGEVFLSPTISGYLLRRRDRQETLRSSLPGLAQLTPMERRVLKLTAENLTCKQIGKALFISHRTVETHRASVARKLGLRGSHTLLQFAIEHRFEL
jgi:DNA-binding NarL/FixJ family response regulator